jgi:hypothetical protein
MRTLLSVALIAGFCFLFLLGLLRVLVDLHECLGSAPMIYPDDEAPQDSPKREGLSQQADSMLRH